jgi:hypothetical protein
VKMSDLFTMRPVLRLSCEALVPPCCPATHQLWICQGNFGICIFNGQMLRPRSIHVNVGDKDFFSANVNSRSLLRIVFGLAQHFMRDGSSVAFTESYVLE